MSDFNLEHIAREYVHERFPRATLPEREKIVRDWIEKVPVSRKIIQDFESRSGPVSGKRILDAGCGNGGVSIALAEAGAIPAGVEVEQELFDIAKKHAAAYGKTIDFHLYDGSVLPFANDTFDAAISLSVLEHTDDPVHYLQEILRVMKPGGILYLAFPNRLWPKETHTGLWLVTYLPRRIMPAVVTLLGRNPLKDNNLHFYAYWDLLRMLKIARDGNYSWKLIPEKGKTTSGAKRALKKMLGFFGIPHRALLAHVMVLLRKDSFSS